MMESELRLPLFEKILCEAEEFSINDLIQIGWHMLPRNTRETSV